MAEGVEDGPATIAKKIRDCVSELNSLIATAQIEHSIRVSLDTYLMSVDPLVSQVSTPAVKVSLRLERIL